MPLSMRRPDRLNTLIRLEHYNIPTYDGDAVHIVTEIPRRSMSHADVKQSWNRVIKGRLEVIPIPGTHSGIIQEPEVGRLAAELAHALEKARAGAGPGKGSAKKESAKDAAQ